MVAPEVRVALIEDHDLFGHGLLYALRGEGMITQVVDPTSVDEVCHAAAAFDADVVLLDYRLGEPMGTGLDLIAPLSELGAAVVMLTGERDRYLLAECLEAGACGIVGKSAPFEELVDAVRTAATGQQLDPAEHHAMLRDLRLRREEDRRRFAPFRLLTGREQEVLDALGRGLSAAEIAEESFVSLATVRTQIRGVLVKLGVGSQLAAVARARQAGWTLG